jgi:glutamate synthase domain-containing protein 2
MRLVHHLAAGGTPHIESGGSQREPGSRLPGYDDLAFRPAQLARAPLAANDVVDTATVIGARAAKPLRLTIPLLVSHLSYGAISIEAKVALARGAREVGTAIGSGDGGVHGRERDAADKYIVQVGPGSDPYDGTEADAIEIKIGEGGRPGLGGHLPGINVTTEVGLHRDVQPGADVNTHVPATSLVHLRRRVDDLRERSGGVPIGVKIAAGDIEADLAAAVEIGADYIALDGFGAATGAAPVHVKDHVGIPSVPAIHRARAWLDRNGVDDVQLVASGGFRTPDEIAKALALGADAVAIGTAALLAVGCQQYRACHRGTCPVGIATQDAELRLRLNPDISGHRLATFLRAATGIVTDYCRVAGRRAVADLRPTDLVALTPEVAAVAGLPYLN